MKNINIGKYLPLDSIIHKLDPRAKMISLLLLLIAVFCVGSWYEYLIIVLIEIIILKLSKLNISYVIKALKPIYFMMLFLLIVNMLVIKTGDVLWKFWIFEIYSDAIFNTLFVLVRLILMIVLSTILTVSTKPVDLTFAIEYFLNPLKRFKFPSHEISMMLSIALRFIPDILDEANKIMNAQKSRGVDFDEGKLKEKIIALLSLIIPLFATCFQKAYDLADAMDARGYVIDAPRTRYRKLVYSLKDFIALSISLIVLVLVLVINL